MTFKPFADEAASQDIAGLTFENHIDRISIYGQSVIMRDQQGLTQILAIQAQLNEIIATLQASDLSVQVENKPIIMVDNPFESN